MYKLVYDVSNSIFPFMKFPLFFLGMFLVIFFIQKKEKKSKIALWFAMLFIFMLFTGSVYIGISKKYKLSKIKPSLIEGEIINFIPMPYHGHALESFTVGNVSFSYADGIFKGCYNETKSHGGAIQGNGQRIKIAYTENCIMQLWVLNEND